MASCIFFCHALWPDFSIFHLFLSIIHYQQNYDTVQQRKRTIQKLKRDFSEKEVSSTSDKILAKCGTHQKTNIANSNSRSYKNKGICNITQKEKCVKQHRSDYEIKIK